MSAEHRRRLAERERQAGQARPAPLAPAPSPLTPVVISRQPGAFVPPGTVAPVFPYPPLGTAPSPTPPIPLLPNAAPEGNEPIPYVGGTAAVAVTPPTPLSGPRTTPGSPSATSGSHTGVTPAPPSRPDEAEQENRLTAAMAQLQFPYPPLPR